MSCAYKPDDGSKPEEYLRKLAYEGLERRYHTITDEIRERVYVVGRHKLYSYLIGKAHQVATYRPLFRQAVVLKLYVKVAHIRSIRQPIKEICDLS